MLLKSYLTTKSYPSNRRGTLIAFGKDMDYKLKEHKNDGNGRLQICSILIEGKKFLLVNVYNNNTENKQIETIKKLDEMMHSIEEILDHEIIIGGDFNFILDKDLDALGGNPKLKLKSIAELTRLKQKYNLCDIYRIRNPNTKRFTFFKPTPKLCRRLDYFLISNTLQDMTVGCDATTSYRSDHAPIYLRISPVCQFKKGPSLWKYNANLGMNIQYCQGVKGVIEKIKQEQQNISHQAKWEFIKYKIREFSISFSKKLAKEKREKMENAEKIIFQYENSEDHNVTEEIYTLNKREYQNILDEKMNGQILRSKVQNYQFGEKSSKFFLSLEKRTAKLNTLTMVCKEDSDDILYSSGEINKEIKNYFSSLFKRKSSRTKQECKQFLETKNFPKLNENHLEMLNTPITIEDLKMAIKNSQSGKSPGSDGLTREFYIVFWNDISELLFNSLIEGKEKGILSTSQRQAVIKLLDKGKDKRYIKNQRPISLINYDTKMLSKTLADRLRSVLPHLVSCDQTAYVPNRFLGESVRLISDILETTKNLNIEGYMLAIDIEKAFDSVDYEYLFATLEAFGFRGEFYEWIKILLKGQESCVINGGLSTGFFKLERGSRQGDPISAYLFILIMETYFTMVKSREDINKLEILNSEYLITSYADDTTFFIKDIDSVGKIFEVFGEFSTFSGLNVNKSKCQISGIGSKNGVQVAFPGIQSVNLSKDYIRILGVYFSYDVNLFNEKNFCETIEKIEKIIAIWRWRNLSVHGRITIFKTLALAKIIFASYLSCVPYNIIKELEKIQKDFIWNGKPAKVKHYTLISDYENGGLKDIDIKLKFTSLQLSWLKRLFGQNYHPWKDIPIKMLKEKFGCSEIFYPNVVLTPPAELPNFYKQMIKKWSEITQKPLTLQNILNQQIWHNSFIKVNNLPILICL